MSSSEVIDLTINTTETQSVSKIASKCARRIGEFAEKHGVDDDYDERKTEEDIIYFLVKRNDTHLEELEISILDDGSIDTGDVISGRRIADLILRFHYKKESGVAQLPKIVIKATKFSRSPESWDVFEQRGWRKVLDDTDIPQKRRKVKIDKESTSLIDLLMEEYEYE